MAIFSWTRREGLLLGFAALLAIACLIAFEMGRTDWVLWLKPLPVLLLATLLRPRRDLYSRLLVVGLIFSAIGDVLLELGPQRFLWGVGAFFLAHLTYIAAFLKADRRPRLLAALPAVALGLLVFPRLLPGLEKQGMLVPVAVYTLALCTMMWRALARCGTGASASANAPLIAGAVGATAFALSDSLIALDRFAPEGAGFAEVRIAILVLYWLGQVGITLSAPPSFR